ncbi:MAG TPA: DUF1343 domain-containing protein [Bacteroidia bacterium]|nr:DUF1343 domain-containing protein [Bacteroidia bacterium]
MKFQMSIAKVRNLLFFFIILISLNACSQDQYRFSHLSDSLNKIKTGAERMEEYLPLLENKNVGIVCNQTAQVRNIHLVDTLTSRGVMIKTIFAPEHGFRGEAGAGEKISSGIDPITGISVVSLYGNKKAPDDKDLQNLDILVFDIQDVGTRFYTFISTLQLVMEACAKNNKEIIVLDRPNPNGFYIDGPVLNKKFKSFVGMQSIPIVYGMTIAEYALMLNGENLLESKQPCSLKVITCSNYSHTDRYHLPVAPSPNLPNMASVYLYPSLCFFEGTNVSLGRGTDLPFQVFGFPGFELGGYQFTPKSIEGKAKNPPHEGKICNGVNLQEFGSTYMKEYGGIYLPWLIESYKYYPDKEKFFNSFFDKLSGNYELKEQIKSGKTEAEIKASWRDGIDAFKLVRKKYLLYEDFE